MPPRVSSAAGQVISPSAVALAWEPRPPHAGPDARSNHVSGWLIRGADRRERYGLWTGSSTVTQNSRATLANLIPLVVEREVFVDDPLTDRLNPVEPRVALVTRFETRGDVERLWRVNALDLARIS